MKTPMKKKLTAAIVISAVILALLLALILFALVPILQKMSQETKALEVNTYRISDSSLPDGFSGFRIAQVSDLHNTEFGENNEKLLTLLEDSEPDIIVFTGDMIDSRHTDVDIAVSFAEEAMKLAPCYFVNGNHEASTTARPELLERLRALGVVVLEDQAVTLEHGGDTITLLGIDDPTLSSDYPTYGSEGVVAEVLSGLTDGLDSYTLLLAHHPEWIQIYKDCGVDLVLSGHTHGGQLRFEKIGALIAPGQGLFPKYDAGEFQEDGTTMIISRGLGNSLLPLRLNNPPELVIVEFE